LGLDDQLGTVEAVRLAELIEDNGDPLKNISILREKKNIFSVFEGGVQVTKMNFS